MNLASYLLIKLIAYCSGATRACALFSPAREKIIGRCVRFGIFGFFSRFFSVWLFSFSAAVWSQRWQGFAAKHPHLPRCLVLLLDRMAIMATFHHSRPSKHATLVYRNASRGNRWWRLGGIVISW